MRRDFTVWVGLAMVVIAWGVGLVMGMPTDIDANSPLAFHTVFWVMLVGSLRVSILWFQTLIHGVQHARLDNRVAVVLGHVFLGPIMAYAYYISARLDAKRGLPLSPADRQATTVLTEVPDEQEAALLVSTLRREGIAAQMCGFLTAGFRADAPGQVQVLVNTIDIERARLVVADWANQSPHRNDAAI